MSNESLNLKVLKSKEQIFFERAWRRLHSRIWPGFSYLKTSEMKKTLPIFNIKIPFPKLSFYEKYLNSSLFVCRSYSVFRSEFKQDKF